MSEFKFHKKRKLERESFIKKEIEYEELQTELKHSILSSRLAMMKHYRKVKGTDFR